MEGRRWAAKGTQDLRKSYGESLGSLMGFSLELSTDTDKKSFKSSVFPWPKDRARVV